MVKKMGLLAFVLFFSSCDYSETETIVPELTAPVIETAITGTGPDLIITSSNVINFTSSTITYTYTVKNQGTAATNLASIAVQACVSSDLIFFNAGDRAAGGCILATSGQLLPGASKTLTFTSGVAGTFTQGENLLLMVDYGNQVTESDETNNLSNAPIILRADLVITSLCVMNYSSSTVTYSYTVKNQGVVAANLADIAVQACISSDLVFFNTGDRAAGGAILNTSGQILPGDSMTRTFTSSVVGGALVEGEYLLVKVDYWNLINESNETNNISNVQILPRADLVITSLTVSSYTSSTITYTYTVKNQGAAAANLANIAVQAYISSDLIYKNTGDSAAGGAILGTSGQILPGASITKTFTSSVVGGTAAAGKYLLVNADNWNYVIESNENNNLASYLLQ